MPKSTTDLIVEKLAPVYGTGLHAADLLQRHWAAMGSQPPPQNDRALAALGALSGEQRNAAEARYFAAYTDASTASLWYSAADQWSKRGTHPTSISDRRAVAALTAGVFPLVGYDTTAARYGLRFDPTNSETVTAAAAANALTNNKTGATIIACFRPLNANSTLFGFSTAAGTARFQLRTGSSTANKFTLGARRLDADVFTTLDSATAFVTSGTSYIVTAKLDWSTGAGFLRINGTQDATNATLTSAGSTEATDSTECRLSGNTGGAAALYDGFVYEAIFYNSFLPDATCLGVERWLGAIYGVTTA